MRYLSKKYNIYLKKQPTKLSIVILIFYNLVAFSQIDSTSVLTYQEYIKIVTEEHPYAKQAAIKISQGDANLLYARGAFDPEIYTNINQKQFKGQQYYNHINGGLKIPTWFGIELQGGYEQNEGVFLNLENTNPNRGLLHAGISLPIGQGLLIDKRRAELKKAKISQHVSELERQIILNELIFVAGTSYWKWFKTYNDLSIYKDAHRLAKQRLEAVKLGAYLGDRPSIDTLEAGIQVQKILLGLLESEVKFKNTSALLAIYLWADGVVPLELSERTIPMSINKNSILDVNKISLFQIDSLINKHQSLNQSRLYIDQLKIDESLKKNKLLPVVNLKYNPITEYINGESFNNFSTNDYTWGMEFKFPIFLRKERGSLKLTKLKIQEYNLQLKDKQQVLKYKVIKAWNQWNAIKEQINLYTQTVEDANNLLKGERKLFNAGESSLFIVNSRESDYIKTQLKLIELHTKFKTAALTTKYALGELLD